MPIINFYNADITYTLKNKRIIKQSIQALFLAEQKALQQLDVILCSDEYLLNMNKQYLQHDYYTDIITFDISGQHGTAITGELYISLDRVKDNGLLRNIPLKHEILRVVFHGCLHLCGYGDKKKSEITIMRQKEDHYLHLFANK